MQRIIALFLLIILLPILILIALILILSSGMPVFFVQERIGKSRIPFTIYKFRTMTDGKVNFVGKVLRKTGLDEIPQFINIVKGEMSFVGPRPLTLADIERLNWSSESFDFRWAVNPGITGNAQLSNICSAENSIQNDRIYVENKSNLYDFKIILKSLLIPIIGKGKKTILVK